MFMNTNFIEPRIGRLILINLIGNKTPEFCNALLDSYLLKLNLGSDCLELCFWAQNHPDAIILHKYQSFSNQTFKHN